MSTSASAATLTAVSASISTPVRSAVRAVAEIDTPESVTSRSTVTACSAIGWHSGTRSGVRFDPAMPAMRATASASPLGTLPSRNARTAALDSRTRPDARACRAVTSLPDTSTMCAAPVSSTWVSRPELMAPCSISGRAHDISRQAHDLRFLARFEPLDLLGNDDEGVGASQSGEPM